MGRLLAALVAILCLSAGWSAHAGDNLHYRMAASLLTETGALNAEVTVTVPRAMAEKGAGFIMAKGYKVTGLKGSDNAEVTLSDTDKPFPGLQRIYARLKPGRRGDIRFTVTYSGPLFNTGGVNAISPERIELSADSLWYPILENFQGRFTLDAQLKAMPADFVVASPDTVRVGKGHTRLTRTVPRPDIAFSAAPGYRKTSIRHLDFFSRNPDSPLSKTYLTNSPKALDYLENLLGPLPTERAVIAIAERKNGSGYSRPGYLVVADVGADPKLNTVWAGYGYIAHELSHSWWSNADFLSEDYWLVESTAEYVALRFVESELGAGAIREFLDKKQPRAARGGPILGRGRPGDDAVYGKGPLLLFDLEQQIGRKTLDAILASLARRERITTRDFLDELGARAGNPVAKDFEARLRA